MKIELDNYSQVSYRINAYSTGSVVVSNTTYNSSLILSPDTIIDNWRPKNIFLLKPDDLDQIIELRPELVLLGTGAGIHFPESMITAVFNSRNIGLDVMDTGAACRAFNFLASEGRGVVAALFMIEKQVNP